ncbi:MAG: cytochrome c3 family protein, partial [Ignavibacteriae bacterium]|nr:cytochrome c3 family protein [Ignavibacteriota bacterium]
MKIIYFLLAATHLITAQSSDKCLDCHSDKTLTYQKNTNTVSLFVDHDSFSGSVHADLECVDCHADFDPENIPHKSGENISRVDCSDCHDTNEFSESIHGISEVQCFECHSKHEIQEASTLKKMGPNLCLTCHVQSSVKSYTQSIHFEKFKEGNESLSCEGCHGGSAHKIKTANLSEKELHIVCAQCHNQIVDIYEKSLHGVALAKGKNLAPNCISCHNQHNILSSKNPKSKTYKMNVPQLCGNCHKDGTKVSEIKDINQRHVLENYSESIHGDGLFKRGLIVTAVCNDCHTSHNIL